MDKTSEQERSQMLGNMDTKKLLFKLATPAIAAMAFNALYNLIDTFFVARGAGEVAIGALSIAYPIQMIVLSIGLMIGIGSASVFSRAYGRGDKESMRKTVNAALLLNLVLSSSIAAVSYVFIDDLLYLFGARAANIGYAYDYLSVILIALVPFSLSITFNHLTRAEGRAKIAMISLMIGAILNILLDPIFIFDFGLGLGVRGAAIATGIAKTASFAYILYQAYRPESALQLHLPTLHKPDFKMVGQILAIGLPSFVRVSMGGVLVIIVNNLINIHAAEDVAHVYISIYGVINRLLRFSLMPGFGLVQGLIPIVGFNFGAQFYRRLHEVIGFTSKLLFGYFATVFLAVLIFAEPLFSIFSREGDAFFISEGAMAFRIVIAGFMFVTYQVILSSTYQAMGYPVRAFFVSLSRRFIFFIPLAFLFSNLFDNGVLGVWWTFFAADFLTGVMSFIVFRYEMHTLRQRFV